MQDLGASVQESSREARQWKCRYEEPGTTDMDGNNAAFQLKFRISLDLSEKQDSTNSSEISLFKMVLLQQQGTALMFEKFTHIFMNRWNQVDI